MSLLTKNVVKAHRAFITAACVVLIMAGWNVAILMVCSRGAHVQVSPAALRDGSMPSHHHGPSRTDRARLLATSHVPAVITSGHVGNMPAGDVLAVPGSLSVASLFTLGAEDFITTGGTQDDLDLWGGGPHTPRVEIDLTGSTSVTITGIVAGSEGDLLWLWNGGGASGNPDTVTLLNDNAGSSPLNRIWVADGKQVNIPNNDGVLLIYDGGFGWTVFGGATSIIRAQEFSFEPCATPPALSNGSTTNSYDPWTAAGVSTSSCVQQDVAAGGVATVTGIAAAGAPNAIGRVVVFQNTSTSGTILIPNAGDPINDDKILTPGGGTISLASQQSITLIYDDSIAMWRTLAYTGNASQGAVLTAGPTSNPQQDWAPAGFGPMISGINITTGGTDTICGLDSSTAWNGQIVHMTNFTGTVIFFADECPGSSAGNQLFTTAALQRQLGNYGAITFEWVAGKGWVETSESSLYIPEIIDIGSLFVQGAFQFSVAGTFFGDLETEAVAHIATQGTAATITCNGTGATTCTSASCNDISGTLTPNTGATSCTVTFAGSYAAGGPTCTVGSSSSGASTGAFVASRSTAAIVITFTTATTVDYICMGH